MESNLKEKETSFLKKLDNFQTHAASVIHLTSQFKELHAQLDARESELRLRLREVNDREDRIGVREKEAESCKSNLVSMKSLIQKHVDELELLAERVREKREECDVTESRVSEAKDELEECERECGLKRKEIRDKQRELGSIAKSREEMSKEFEKSMKEWCCRIGLKEREVENLFGEFELRGKEFEARVEEVGGIGEKVDECLNEVVVRERCLERLEKSVEEREKSVELVLYELKMREAKIEEREKEFELFVSKVKGEQLEKDEHFASLEKSIEEKEKIMAALESSLQERQKSLDSISHELKIKEGQLREQAKDFELKQLQYSSPVKTEQFEKADKIFDVIRNLIERKQLLGAVRFICAFKLIDKFPPVPLLIEFVKDAKERCSKRLGEVKSHVEKEKVVDDQIADLRAVVQCIEDHGLQYPLIGIKMDIEGLEKIKRNGKLMPSLPPTVEKQEQRDGRKRSSSSLYSTPHTYQLRKRT